MRDLRLSVRSLLATPVVSTVAILSLALGIGANVAIFSLVNSLLLRPLPVSDPASIVTISSDFALGHGFKAGVGWNYAMWRRLHERLGLFGGAVAWSSASFNLSENGATEPANVLFVDGGFFNTLGVHARYGRTLSPADDVKGSPDGPPAVISHRLWQRRFGGQTSAIGKQLVIEGRPFTIVGVTPPEFFGIVVGQTFDVALPIAADSLVRGGRSVLDSERAYLLIVMLRLKPGQSIEAATAALRAIHPDLLGVTAEGLSTVNPSFLREPFVLLPAPTGVSDRGARAQFERPLRVVSIAMALVLLVGSLNLANLSLSRAAARRHEMGVRIALGAPRWHMARRVLFESFVISGMGALAGLVVAAWASPVLVSQLSNANTGLFLHLPLDWRVLLFTAGVAITTTVLFGVVPAYRAARVTPELVRSQQSATDRQRRFDVAGGFVLVQLALSIVLVTGTGLFARTFQRLASAPLGFEPSQVLVTELGAARAHAGAEGRLELYQRFLDRIAATPGVRGVAASDMTPLGGGTRMAVYDDPARIPENPITPGWFAVYGTRVLAGRDFDNRDVAGGAPVAIVNESFVRRHVAGQNPIGQSIGAKRTIVGVAADAAFASVRGGARPLIYLPLAQSDITRSRSTVQISVRSAGVDLANLTGALAAAVLAVDPGVTFATRRLQDDVRTSIAQEGTLAASSLAFAVLALLLAGLGLYGVTTSAVAARRREMAIRMALGMIPAGGVRLVMSRIGVLVVAGTIAGLAASVWLAKYVASLLYGVDARDPVIFAGSAFALATVALGAAWRPARRASRIDPAELLRSE